MNRIWGRFRSWANTGPAYINIHIIPKVIPESGQGRIEYHNELMQLCGLRLRDLVDAMVSVKAKTQAQPPVDTIAAASTDAPAPIRQHSRSRSR